MELNTDQKHLIIDKSGWDPFAFIFDPKNKNILTPEKIHEFLEKCGAVGVVTLEAVQAGEYLHSYKPNLFSGITSAAGCGVAANKIENLSFNSDGTLTSSHILRSGNDVKIISASGFYSRTVAENQLSGTALIKIGQVAKIQELQQPLWESSTHWRSVSNSQSDLSVIQLNRDLAKIGFINAITLVNDWHLREQLKLEGHSVCGSCAVLAEMVLTDIISTQRATYIYKLWGQSNPKILPNKDNVTKEKYVFKEILQLERLKNKRGFWVNQLSS